MKYFLLISLLFSNLAFSKAFECKLSNGDNRIELNLLDKKCEFPEGNKVKCAQIISYVKRENPQIGQVVFREGSSFNDLCITKNKKIIPNTKIMGRVVSESKLTNLYAMMACPSQDKVAKIYLFNGEKTKKCTLKL